MHFTMLEINTKSVVAELGFFARGPGALGPCYFVRGRHKEVIILLCPFCFTLSILWEHGGGGTRFLEGGHVDTFPPAPPPHNYAPVNQHQPYFVCRMTVRGIHVVQYNRAWGELRILTATIALTGELNAV